MPDKSHIIALYAAGASIAAVTLYYILGPTLFPDEEASFGPKGAGAVGLSNPANDCFINSVLQALAGLEDLRVFLRQRSSQSGHQGSRKFEEPPSSEIKVKEEDAIAPVGIVSAALKEILDRLNEKPKNRRTMSAHDFIRSLEFAFRKGLSRRQQDAQEFLQLVAERVCEEYIADIKARHKANNIRQEQDTESSSSKGPDPDQDLQNMINPFPLEGKLSSHIRCTACHFTPSANVSTFVTLTLNVPQLPMTTLDSCLDNLLKLETISDYRCDRCLLLAALSAQQKELAKQQSTANSVESIRSSIVKFEAALGSGDFSNPNHDALIAKASTLVSPPKRTINKHIRISSYPKVLCLHLSRSIFDSSSFSTKNTAEVVFQEYLKLGGLADRRVYRLLCLVTHRGGHNSGHYETFRRQGTNVYAPSSVEGKSGKESKEVPSVAGQTARRRARRQRQRQHDKWWRISDDKIGECRTSDVLEMQKEAYLLFYGQVNDVSD